MMYAPTLHLSLSPLFRLNQCEYQQAYKDTDEEGTFHLYHLCGLSENGTEKCMYPSRVCRVKDEDEFFEDVIQCAIDKALIKITQDNLREGNWRERE
jgi:hypothetical protein